MELSQLKLIMPKAPDDLANAIIDAMPRWDISTQKRQSAFLAQLAHESIELTHTEENLNYSANALMKTWPRLFPTMDAAAPFERQPQKIANYVYANRMGNGGPETGDGWMYRGRGPIQLTGRANYRACGTAIGQDLESFPEILGRPYIGAEVSCWYWYSRALNDKADNDDFIGITKSINGGLNGYDDRYKYFEKAKAVLGT